MGAAAGSGLSASPPVSGGAASLAFRSGTEHESTHKKTKKQKQKNKNKTSINIITAIVKIQSHVLTWKKEIR